MSKSFTARKISRFATLTALLGGTAVLLLIGAPADAEMIDSAAKGIRMLRAKGI